MTDKAKLETIRKKDAEIAKLMADISKLTEGMDAISLAELRSGSCFDPETRKVIEESIARQKAISSRRMRKDITPLDIAIVGGAGKMGAWFGDFLSMCGHRITVIDPASGNGRTLQDCRDADAVIVSVPIHATAQVLRDLDTVCKKDALIFDLTSLKSPVIDTLKDMASRRNVCSVHPMFGPSAESLDDRNMIICDCGNRSAAEQVFDMFDGFGGNLRMIDIAQHDVYMSYVLGMSHAVNIAFFTALDRSGLSFEDLESVASTTFRKNIDTNVSVALEDPVLYYDIQHLNAHRDEMWDLFSKAVEDLKKASLSDDPSAFIELMNRGRNYFSKKQ